MIAICPNPFRDLDLEYTRKTEKLLNDEGFETVICPVFCEEEAEVLPEDIEFFNPQATVKQILGGKA